MVTMEQALGLLALVVALSAVEVTSNPIFGGLHPAATTPYTHISSFLNQRRSTGGNGPRTDGAPNSEMDAAGTTTERTILIGRVFGNIRDRVSNAIAQGRDERIFADRLQLQGAKPDEADPEDATTEFVGLSLDEDSDGPNVVFETTNNTSEEPGNLGPGEGSSNMDGFLAAKFKNKTRALATLVFTPLLSVWTTAQRNLHFPAFGGDSSGSGIEDEFPDESQDLQQNTDGVQSSWIKGEIKQNLRGTPFRRAFAKYSNFAGLGGSNNNDNPAPGSPEAARSVSAAGSGANLDNGGLDDDDDKPPPGPDPTSATTGPRLMLSEGLGIYVLEIIGTIVGLTWGAISQIQNIFGGGGGGGGGGSAGGSGGRQ